MSETEVDTSFLIRDKRAERGLALARTPGAIKKVPRLLNFWQIWKVKSQTSQGIMYTVVEKSDGELMCDCPDFTSRPDILFCKHIYGCMYAEVLVK